MNVLFVTNWFPSEHDPSSGVFVREHAEAVARLGHNVTVMHINVYKRNSLMKLKIRQANENSFRVVSINIGSFMWKIIYLVPSIQFLFVKYAYWKVLKSTFVPAIVHSHVIFPAGFLGYKLSSRIGVPHVLTEHWSQTKTFLTCSVLRFRAKQIFRRSVSVMPVSKFLRKEIIDVIPELRNIIVIPNVVDCIDNCEEINC